MPLVMIEELPETIILGTAEKHMMQVIQHKRKEPLQVHIEEKNCYVQNI